MIINENIQNMIISKRLCILESELSDFREDFKAILNEDFSIVLEEGADTNKEMIAMFRSDVKEYKAYFKSGMKAYKAHDNQEAIVQFTRASKVITELDNKLRHIDLSANSALISNILGALILLGPYTIAQCFFFYNMNKAEKNIPMFVWATSDEEMDAKMKVIKKEKAKYYGSAVGSIITSLVAIVKSTKLIKTNLSKRFYGKPSVLRNMLVSYISNFKDVCENYIKMCKEADNK